MTTDITELAQRVKTEASAIDDTQWYLAKPSEIRSLVEALKKAQETIAFQQREIKALLSSLESRTVTVKPMRPGHITVGGEKLGIYMRDEVDEFLAALTAAGIKWEAE